MSIRPANLPELNDSGFLHTDVIRTPEQEIILQSLIAKFEVKEGNLRPRLYLFEDKKRVTIGFDPACDLVLEPSKPDGASLKLQIQSDGTATLQSHKHPGTFLLDGATCNAEMPVKTGGVISHGTYKITVLELPVPEPREETDETRAPLEQQEDVATTPMSPGTTASIAATLVGATGDETTGAALQPAPEPVAMPAPKPAPKVAPAEAKPAPAPAAMPEPAAKPVVKKSGLSYLYLFFGPVREFLEDDSVSEVLINGPRQIYIERKGKLVLVDAKFASEQALQAAVMNVARSVGRFFDKDNPRLDARLPDGSRVHAVMPPLCRAGTTVAIRKFSKEKLTLQQLVNFGSISPEGARLLDIIVKLGKNLIVSGATSSGKTSVLNVLSALIPETERILVLEDASELQLQQPHTVCFETRKPDEHGKGEVSIRDLVNSALRLRPDRLVVGEIRGGEALDLLQAMNTGHDGSMSTIHSNSARDCLFRLETCAMLSGVEIPLSALREQVGSAVHVVIQTARLHDGTRKITGITEVLGLKDHEYQWKDILIFKDEGVQPDHRIAGRHVFTGYRPTFITAAERRGIDCSGLFPE